MLARQKNLIQGTWAQVVPIADQAAAIFYQRLFEIDPSTRACSTPPTWFSNARSWCRSFRWRCRASITWVPLARRSRTSGIGTPLMASRTRTTIRLAWHCFGTLEQALGAAWTPQAAAAWKEVYGFLSSIMRNAQPAARVKVAA